MNKKFAKIEDGHVVFAPRKLIGVPMEFPPEEEGGEPVTMLCTVTNPTDAQYLAAGWLPVIETRRPADGDGYHYVESFELGNDDTTGVDELVQVWERVDDPPPSDEDEISAEEALEIILGGGDHEA